MLPRELERLLGEASCDLLSNADERDCKMFPFDVENGADGLKGAGVPVRFV